MNDDRKPAGGSDGYPDLDPNQPQDLIIQECWLSGPLPGSAAIARWTTVLRSLGSRIPSSLTRYQRPWMLCAVLAVLAAAVLAVLTVPARVTAHPARVPAPAMNTVSEEASLSRQVATADCTALSGRHLASATVDRARADAGGSFTVSLGWLAADTVLTGLPAFCDVRLEQVNPPAADRVYVEAWLPLVAWNGRFQGVGGSWPACEMSYSALARALRGGYAAAAINCGPPAGSGSRALAGPPVIGVASSAGHEITKDGAAVTTAFYGIGPGLFVNVVAA
jgi:hypothetical protein